MALVVNGTTVQNVNYLKLPYIKLNRESESMSCYTYATIKSYSTLKNDTWGTRADQPDLKVGDYCCIVCYATDQDYRAYVIKFKLTNITYNEVYGDAEGFIDNCAYSTTLTTKTDTVGPMKIVKYNNQIVFPNVTNYSSWEAFGNALGASNTSKIYDSYNNRGRIYVRKQALGFNPCSNFAGSAVLNTRNTYIGGGSISLNGNLDINLTTKYTTGKSDLEQLVSQTGKTYIQFDIKNGSGVTQKSPNNENTLWATMIPDYSTISRTVTLPDVISINNNLYELYLYQSGGNAPVYDNGFKNACNNIYGVKVVDIQGNNSIVSGAWDYYYYNPFS